MGRQVRWPGSVADLLGVEYAASTEVMWPWEPPRAPSGEQSSAPAWTGLWSRWACRSSGSPPPGPLAPVLVASPPRERQVYVMGDKSPRSKDKDKKQSTKKKAREKATHDKKQAPKLPGLSKT